MAGEGMKIFLEIDNMLTEVLSVMSIAYRYNFHVRTIQKWADEGKIIAYEIEGRWWIPVQEIERFVLTKDYYRKVMAQYE